MTFLPFLSSSMTSAVTRAPLMLGLPTWIFSPSAINKTSSSAISLPFSPSRSSTSKTSPGWTRYCLAPVRITAYMNVSFSFWEGTKTILEPSASVNDYLATLPRSLFGRLRLRRRLGHGQYRLRRRRHIRLQLIDGILRVLPHIFIGVGQQPLQDLDRALI